MLVVEHSCDELLQCVADCCAAVLLSLLLLCWCVHTCVRDLWTNGIQKCRKVPTRSINYLYCSLAVMAAELGKLSEARAWFQEGTR